MKNPPVSLLRGSRGLRWLRLLACGAGLGCVCVDVSGLHMGVCVYGEVSGVCVHGCVRCVHRYCACAWIFQVCAWICLVCMWTRLFVRGHVRCAHGHACCGCPLLFISKTSRSMQLGLLTPKPSAEPGLHTPTRSGTRRGACTVPSAKPRVPRCSGSLRAPFPGSRCLRLLPVA